jgi:hypothetical protein
MAIVRTAILVPAIHIEPPQMAGLLVTYGCKTLGIGSLYRKAHGEASFEE